MQVEMSENREKSDCQSKELKTLVNNEKPKSQNKKFKTHSGIRSSAWSATGAKKEWPGEEVATTPTRAAQATKAMQQTPNSAFSSLVRRFHKPRAAGSRASALPGDSTGALLMVDKSMACWKVGKGFAGDSAARERFRAKGSS